MSGKFTPTHAKLKILRRRATVRTINLSTNTGSSLRAAWDGRNNFGRPVGNGEYSVKLEVRGGGRTHTSRLHAITVGPALNPIADAGADQRVTLDEATNSVRVSFDGSDSHDPDGGANKKYAWNFGEGATPGKVSGRAKVQPSCSYNTIGTKTVTLTVTDNENVTAIDTCIVTVVPSGLVAVAGADQTVSVDSTVNFDGSDSVIPQGRQVTYTWDFGDGTSGSGVQTTHPYTESGVYDVTLTITDGQGTMAEDALTVTAFNGTLSVDTNRIVIPEDPPEDGASGASGGGTTTKTTTPPPLPPPPDPDPPIIDPPIVTPPTATITCDVLPAGFTPTSVYAEIHNGAALDATTLVKEIALTETFGGSNSYTGSWDGRDGNDAPVANGDFQIVGVVNHQANGAQSTYTTPPAEIAVSDGSIQVLVLTSSHDYLAGGQDATAAAIRYEIDPATAVPFNATDIKIVKDSNPVLNRALPHPTAETQLFLWNGKTGPDVHDPPKFVTDASNLGYGVYDVTVEVHKEPSQPIRVALQKRAAPPNYSFRD